MPSHVEAEIERRIARARLEEERKRREREEFAAARAKGLTQRHAQKLRALAQRGLDLVPPVDLSNQTLAASGAL